MDKSNEMLMKPFNKALSELNNPYIQEAQSNGKRVIGFFCSYMPPELIDAGGMIPFRVKGKPGRDIGLGTTYLSARLCTFSRNALTLVLENEYSFLDGFVGCNSCDHIRRTSQNWFVKKPANFTHFLHTPRVYGKENISFYKDQLINLKKELEQWSGKKISDEDLCAASLKYNKARGILRKLSMLRKHDKPALSGSEMLTISVAYHQMPVDDFIPAAESLLESLDKDKLSVKGSTGKARLLLCGGMIDEPEYVAFIEEQGIDIVADPVCFGMRSYWDDVDMTGEPMAAIAERALTHFPCPHIGDSFERRWDTIRQIYEDYQADGIIYQKLKFCQIWGVDSYNITPKCEKLGIPFLSLEREYGFFSTGQVKTRLQAFTELIEERKAAV